MNKIGIFGVPRSGTSWLAQIFNSHPEVVLRYQPLFSYGHKGGLSEHSSAEDIHAFFEEILHSQDAFATMKSEMHRNHPSFHKAALPTCTVFKETRYLHIIENMLERCNEIKIVGIVRNPLAVLASWVSAPKEFDSNWNIRDEWRMATSKNQGRIEEFYGFDKWKEAAEEFLRYESRFPRQFRLVHYDQLNDKPLDTTKQLFVFCGLGICGQVEDFLTASKLRHDLDPYSVYRAQASDDRWPEILPEEIVKQVFSELKDSPLSVFLRDATNA